MSQGFEIPISKEQIAIIQGTDEPELNKIYRKIRRSGWKKTFNNYRKKD